MKKLLLLIILFSSTSAIAQEKAIGSWTDHLSYSTGTSIDTDGQNIYCGTTSGLFIYNTKDNSIQRKNKINGLTEVSVQKVAYNKYNGILLIVYKSGGIDIIQTKNDQLYSIPFLKNSITINNKTINHIYFENEFAYLSFSFGIMVINTDKNEVNETYQFGNNGENINVNATITDNNKIIAATNKGVYHGSKNKNLLDFNNWIKINQFSNNNIKKTFKHNGIAYVVVQDVNNKDSLFSFDENLQFTKLEEVSGKEYNNVRVVNEDLLLLDNSGLIEIYDSNMVLTHSFQIEMNGIVDISTAKKYFYLINTRTPVIEYEKNGVLTKEIKPIGPINNDVFDIVVNDKTLWSVNGGYDFAINNSFKYINLNLFENGEWTNYNNFNTSSLTNVYDAISVETHPKNSKNVFVSTWGNGLFEMNNNLPFNRYDETNSPIRLRQAFANWRGVSDVAFDPAGNLWGVNTHVPSAIFVKTTDNNWYGFEMTGSTQEIVHEDRLTEIVITPGGLKWVAMPLSNNILVFDENGTIQNKNDDRYLILTQESGKGNIPGSRGITMEVDKNGQLWVGTSEGIVVNYNPDKIFNNDFKDFEEVIINDGNNNEVVLKGAVINDIEIDGANRKWIATEGSGVFLFSPDLKKQVLHFTEENSPLISNNIKVIAFDEITGDVYFGTSLGIEAYKSEVIAGYENFNDVVIYPNPVESNYDGPIAIKGLMDNTTVKITDINGTLVNEIITEGGQAIWYGTNFNGEKVSSGVYLIFNSAEDEFGNLSTQIGKVLFLR